MHDSALTAPADTASLIAADHSAAYQRFIAVTAPQWVWKMEVDLIQRDAATCLLNHIECLRAF